MSKPSEWQHAFGPVQSPVVIAGVSEQVRALVAAIGAIGGPEPRKCLVVEGGEGSGKSLAAVAFQAACQASGTDVVLVNEGSEPATVIPRIDAGTAIIVDNLDGLPDGLRAAMFERRHAPPGGSLLTASRLTALERQLLSTADDYHLMVPLEDRPLDVLVIAALKWRDLGLKPDLPDLCAEGAPESFSPGPWTKGAHSVRRFTEILAEALSLEGYFERTPRPIEVADVLSALLAVIREERPSEEEDTIRIVVEGSTDAVYLEEAARLAEEEWGADLLSGCCVAAPGPDREGGAQKAMRELISLEARSIIGVGLLDNDEPGRMAAKQARMYTNQRILHLPGEFDPLGGEKTEIEDLLPVPLLERFYDAHPDLEPEERTTRGTLVRIVVAWPDKERLARWVSEHASFKELERVVYVLCMLRRSIGLPLPDKCPPPEDWIKQLSSC